MFGILYILLSTYLGYMMTRGLCRPRLGNEYPDHQSERIRRIWIQIPAAFGVGTLLVTWSIYILAWIFSCSFAIAKPLLPANLIVLLIMSAICGIQILLWYKRRQGIGKTVGKWKKLTRQKEIGKEFSFFILLFLFVLVMFFYVFFVNKGLLHSGFTVYSDYAPHTAMMRSFSLGNNFPTQYPHFGGEDVKYHFMFQFLIGNLEYLGMRIDIAYNLMSAFSLTGFLMILFCLVKRLTGGFWAGIIAVLLFFFRSGITFFRYVMEHVEAGDLLQTLENNTAFIGYTTNENWGFWNFNVYLNQRHLAFGLLLGAFVIWVFLEWLERGCYTDQMEMVRLRKLLFSKEGWKFYKPEAALLLGLILGLTSFWNGAVVIGCLLILAGMALFSVGKLDYALMAAVSVILSVLQSKLFITGSAISPSIYFGFLADERTLPGVAKYLFMITGFFFLGLLPVAFAMNRKQRAMAFGFSLPLVFAFVFSLTPDVAVNHKYIMIAYAFMTIFWAGILEKLIRKNCVTRIAAVLLAICLTATGIYDFVIIIRNNGESKSLIIPMEDDVTEWLSDTLQKDDLILTPEYSMNTVTMSGVMLYCGWPYYAWSAGYDTYYRADVGRRIYGGNDVSEVQTLLSQERITYILFEDDVKFEETECNEDVIASLYPIAYTSKSGTIRIYRIR